MTLIPSGIETNAQYHASGAWGSSRINDFIKSPQVAWLRHTGKLRQDDSSALTLGSAFHGRFDGTYHQLFAPGPQVSSRRTKAWTEAAAEHPGKTLLLPSEVAVIDAMEKSARTNPYAGCLLEDSQAEVGVRRDSPFGNYKVQCRIDIFAPGHFMADLKTTGDLDSWAKSVVTYGYHRQAAFYRWLCEQETGYLLPFSFVVVEKQAPYRCRVIDLDDIYLETGWREVEQALKGIGYCCRTGDWSDPQYQQLEAPGWMVQRMNTRSSAA